MIGRWVWGVALAAALAAVAAAESAPDGAAGAAAEAIAVAAAPRPGTQAGIPPAVRPPARPAAAAEAASAAAAAKGRGPVTNLPLPRYVTLKTDEGYARRGPGLSHRIDWVFTRAGMPLRVTAEFEHWRRVEDAEGAGGWVHYALLSGTRSVLVVRDMTELRSAPDPAAPAVAVAEYGVVARLLRCDPDWCRINAAGTRGWAPRAALWGVDPGEIVE